MSIKSYTRRPLSPVTAVQYHGVATRLQMREFIKNPIDERDMPQALYFASDSSFTGSPGTWEEANPGDWVVLVRPGRYAVMSNEAFHNEYQQVDEVMEAPKSRDYPVSDEATG